MLFGRTPLPPTRLANLEKLILSTLPLLAPKMVQLLLAVAPCSVLVPLPPLKVVVIAGAASRVSVSLPLAVRLS